MADDRAGQDRRQFLKQTLVVAGGAALPVSGAAARDAVDAPPGTGPADAAAQPSTAGAGAAPADAAPRAIAYPRVFAGPQLAMIAFPLGGVGAGSISLGGRGQLRDWEIFNRPDKGNVPAYAFPAIRVAHGTRPPIARVLEARRLPPYEGSSGLGSNNVPGLQRLASATFTGEYPIASIAFADPEIPVAVTLEAFTPFIPHDADESGLPVAVLRYRVRNPTKEPANVAIAYAIENPVLTEDGVQRASTEGRLAEIRQEGRLRGLLMTNPKLPHLDPRAGSFGLWTIDEGADASSAASAPASGATSARPAAGGAPVVSLLRGWPRAKWWTSVLHYWDDFSQDGQLGPEADAIAPVGAICVQRTLAPGAEAPFTFLLSWHFPNRTPDRCGWQASKGDEDTIIGNFYTTRFADAWAAARHAAQHLAPLERRTRQFTQAMRESTIPAAIKDAASANLSTLATQTCFRTADGEFHGFEGSNNQRGCCHGNCTHVWNYETTTPHLFPSLSRSLRRAAFGYSMDDEGAMHFRQTLPDGKDRSGFAAADGQMGQIIKVYQDWRLSGDRAFLDALWPRVRKAIAFCWVTGGWDADRDGVMEGVQHNTYDVEFYGPNPQCGLYYLGALRAAEELARVVGDADMASQCRGLFEKGRAWVDAHLFNGEYYTQQVRGTARDRIHRSLMSTMGSEATEQPEYQVGDGCLVDQLVGQYLAEVVGLGPLVAPANCLTTLRSIHRYNMKRALTDHACLQRTYALNDEAALVICDYGKGERPKVPFPYYAEAWTGLEYCVGAHMIYAGLLTEGVECFAHARARHDGERRNPWDEPECGHHYARAMSAWSGLLAWSGFRYDAATQRVEVRPRGDLASFRSFWSTGTGWGTFACDRDARTLTLDVLFGALPCKSIARPAPASGGGSTSVTHDTRAVPHRASRAGDDLAVELTRSITVAEGQRLVVRI